jgi:hypothetical protein
LSSSYTVRGLWGNWKEHCALKTWVGV